MVYRHRGILAGVVLVGLLAVGAALALTFAYPPLPDPSLADREQLLRWLVTEDLTEMPSAKRLVLAQRLEAEFSDGFDWEATQQRLDEPRRQQLWENIPVLLEPWLVDKASAYGELSAAEQGALLDACLETLNNWKQVEALRPEGSDFTGQPQQVAGGLHALFLAGINRSRSGVTPEQCGEIDRFAVAIQCRWLAKKLQRFLPVGP